MIVDKIIERTKQKKNPCIVGIDPEWDKIPVCYKQENISKSEVIYNWAIDIIDTVADIVPAIKPQIAFFEIYGAEGLEIYRRVIDYAHKRDLIVIDDSKRNDIGNTAKAYAYAHLSKDGPINADYITVSPFLGTDSIQPFIDMADKNDKGLFILVKTSNPSSFEISEAINQNGEKVSEWLAGYIKNVGDKHIGENGYSSIGAVVGATYPKEAKNLRKIMCNNYLLVPGFGVQGGSIEDIVNCFNDDGLGALVSSSRGIIYKYLELADYDNSKHMYKSIVKEQVEKIQEEVYIQLKKSCKKMEY